MTRHTMDSQSSFSWNSLLRYQLIEIIALWEGRLNTNHLMAAFGIGRHCASDTIKDYNTQVAPDNLKYDRHKKGYRPGTQFLPVVTKGAIDEYIHLLNGRHDSSAHTFSINPLQAHTEMIVSPARLIVPEFICPVICAARDGMSLNIHYMSFSSDKEESRVITPHTLVYSGYRWHIRAHCDKHNDYRDFVLSRISKIPQPVTQSEHGIKNDSAWNTEITLRITPDPRLTEFQQKILMHEYSMCNGVLEIKTRAALTQYYLHFLGIKADSQEVLAEAQQLVLENITELKQWLF